MDNSYQTVTESSTTYRYKLVDQPNTYILAWSTTPWNKIATPALAVHPDFEYVKAKQGDHYYIVVASRAEAVLKSNYEVVETFTGNALTQFQFEPHYDFFPDRSADEKIGVIIADEFVTADDGTGVVTLAVYGEDDYRVMSQHAVQLTEHVDEEGRLKPAVKPWAGMTIEEVNPLVNKDLAERGLIYDDTPHTHNVATCYRCSTRLYYAPIPAWFIDVQQLKQTLLENNQHINWVPQHLQDGRFGQGLENAPDWNISRSRYWGTPMPIWQSADGSQRRVISSIAELKKWAVDPAAVSNLTDIHRQFVDDVEVWVDEQRTITGKRIPEVFDCWVESGSMPFASLHYPFENRKAFESSFPAQFVSEYIAQTRAWFYTMHVISSGIFGTEAFQNVLTTGTILAEDGSKMSKSKKNYPDPMTVIDEYGVDSLRLYLMSSTVMKSENLNFNQKDVADIRRKVFVIWWNMLKFYQQASDQTLDVTTPPEPHHILDKWLLSYVQTLIHDTTQDMDQYNVVKASRRLMSAVDVLSTWYLRLSRDRVRDSADSTARHLFGHALYTLAQLSAPLTPFFTELVHHTLVNTATSIHHTDWPTVDTQHHSPILETTMEQVRTIVEQGRSLRAEQGVKLRQPLASLTVSTTESDPGEALKGVIAAELNVKEVKWVPESEGETTLVYDWKLTPELTAEGEARELMRAIQQLRRQHKLTRDAVVTVAAPNWPEEWQQEIEQTTKSHLVKNESNTLQLVSDHS